MSANALFLVLCGALCHALWNVYAKKASGGLVFVWLFGLISVVIAAPLALFVWTVNPQVFDQTMWFAALASGFVHVGYSLILQKAYKESDFSLVYPVARGSGPLFSVFLAIFLLGERPSFLGWIGVAMILIGLLISTGIVDFFGNTSVRKRSLGVFWGVSTGFFIAFYTIIDGWAIKSLNMSPILFYSVGLVFRSLFLAPFAWVQRDTLRVQWQQHRRAILIVGALSPLAYVLVLFAVTLAPLSYVAPVREISMLIGLFVGATLLKESVKTSQAVGASLMLLGVISLIWA